MRFFHTLKFLTPLVSLTLFVSTLTLQAQDIRQEHTRPRRAVSTDAQDDVSHQSTTEYEGNTVKLSGEPSIRIGLTTEARSVNISTSGRLLNATETDTAPVPFEVSRVRMEARGFPGALPTMKRDDASTELADATQDEASSSSIAARKNQGAAQPSIPQTSRATTSQSNVRLVSRVNVPARGAALYVAGQSRPILEVRAPVIFASDEETLRPVKFNEKAYRGRLEVFANTHGALTVVNVLNLEEYVRGVVPNELSPGGYPAIEALKAQAVAARTYAVSHLGQFAADGFDLLPTTRSQVYGGLTTEHPLTDRAVAETRGLVATYHGQPINALYTSTCGGRTEDVENIFGGEAVPYLRARECSLDAQDSFASFKVRTSREMPNIQEADHAASPRDAALLTAHGFNLPARLTDAWLSSPLTIDEARALLAHVSFLTHQPAPALANDATRSAGFITALSIALDGESRGSVLLDKADVEYLLSFRDADDIPTSNRADVANFLREGLLTLYPDATLRPRLVLPRSRALRLVSQALETRGLFRLQKATARPSSAGALVVRTTAKGADKNLNISPVASLFRAYGENIYQVRELNFVGGEIVTYHLNARGEVDYLEARPSPNGAASDHSSPYSNWTETLAPPGVMSRLGHHAAGIGTLTDLRVRARGASSRVTDLEIIGTNGMTHLRGGKIRSALSLREQLFVIDRQYDEGGRVESFTFRGRGWGHGVGMCQVGAYGLARAGLTYDKILKTYYTGISLTKMY